jgi:hypothetical protein
MVWQWAAGEPVAAATGYRPGVRLRWLRGDIAWLRENLSRRGHVGGVPPRQALGVFSSGFFRPAHYDYVDWQDLGPARVELLSAVTQVGEKLRQALRPARGA